MADIDAIERAVIDVHPDPFVRIDEDVWRAEGERLRELVAEVAPQEATVAMMAWVASLGDGHTNLEPSGLPAFERWYPLRFHQFPEGLYITAAQGPGLPYNGARVLQIGGVPAAEAAARQAALQGADNMFGAMEERYLLSNAGVMDGLGLTDAEGRLTLQLEQDGETVEAVIDPVRTEWHFGWRFWGEFIGPPVSESFGDWRAAYDSEGAADYLTDEPEFERPAHLTYRRPYWYARLGEDRNTVYLGFHFVQQWGEERFADFIARMFAEIETLEDPRLVIDLRYNSGGDGSMLQPLVHAIIRNQALDDPNRLFVLTGPKTFSAAVILVGLLEQNTRATFVGTPPGAPLNHYGDTRRVELPSGMTVDVSALYHQNGYPGQTGRLFPVDALRPMTAQAYFAGEDPALDAILADDDLRPIEVVAAEDGVLAATLRADSTMAFAQYHGWEGFKPFNQYPVASIGYQAMLNGDIEGGTAVLEMVVRYYPESSRAHRQLGDAYARAERIEDARASYERALELDAYNSESLSGLTSLRP